MNVSEEQSRDTSRVWFYAVPVDHKWLMELARNTYPDKDYSDEALIRMGTHAVWKSSGLRGKLEMEFGCENPEGGMTVLLSLFSSEEASYKKRPSQAELQRATDFLMRELGERPEWWETADYM
ncbi:hypothetical protein A0H81_12086 [Grifola frondosa]|uniref:Uncharacterized protein n=1 Tax=Grifola frondosa TaxID=5627 RepID=A0A1C7LUR3_GRIFR|nr:hypothetical protein A0H81_12086 [Grifola frondosa]